MARMIGPNVSGRKIIGTAHAPAKMRANQNGHRQLYCDRYPDGTGCGTRSVEALIRNYIIAYRESRAKGGNCHEPSNGSSPMDWIVQDVGKEAGGVVR